MIDGYWLSVRDGDPRARALFVRHYSARSSTVRAQAIGNYAMFAGPGEKMVLLTRDCDALFVWRREQLRVDNQAGVNCSIFRNESRILSSVLIREADELAWQRWPGERHFTFVDGRKVRSINPGACFKKAGWKRCGESRKGLVILELLPPAATLEGVT